MSTSRLTNLRQKGHEAGVCMSADSLLAGQGRVVVAAQLRRRIRKRGVEICLAQTQGDSNDWHEALSHLHSGPTVGFHRSAKLRKVRWVLVVRVTNRVEFEHQKFSSALNERNSRVK